MVTLAGSDFRIIDLGPGESADITVIHVPQADTLIVSDLVYHLSYPWMAEHRTDAWLAQIAPLGPKMCRTRQSMLMSRGGNWPSASLHGSEENL